MPAAARYAIALGSSLMFGLAAPPGGLNALAWFGFAPLLVLLRGAPPQRLRSIFGLGVVGGLCTGLVGFPWIAELLVRFAGVPWVVGGLGLLAFATWTALPFGLWAIAVVRGPQHGWQRVVWPIASWIAIADVWPHLFPYTPIIGFAEVPAWIQAAELAGVPAVETQVLLVGLLLADAVVGGPREARLSRRARLSRAAIALAIPLLSTALGTWRLAAIDTEIAAARHVKVGLVQPNNALMDHATGQRMHRLHSMSAAAQADGAQLVVWPEAGAFPYAIQRPFKHDLTRSHRRILRGFRLPTIFGAGTMSRDEEFERNSVYNMAADGTVRGRFDKVKLVPIGEYVPVIDPKWLRRKVPAVSHNIAGDGPVRFAVDPSVTPERPEASPTFHAGPLVCYEDIFPDFARRVAAQDEGIELFVNVTIDTWFGDTAEPWEHLALAQFRSVEHRIPMVRSVAAGASSSVDAGGRLIDVLDVTAPSISDPVPAQYLVTDVALVRNTERRPTIYSRAGWLLPWACQAWLVVLAGIAALARFRRRPYKRPPADSAEQDAEQDP